MNKKNNKNINITKIVLKNQLYFNNKVGFRLN
jgi:hypothetical protein